MVALRRIAAWSGLQRNHSTFRRAWGVSCRRADAQLAPANQPFSSDVRVGSRLCFKAMSTEAHFGQLAERDEALRLVVRLWHFEQSQLCNEIAGLKHQLFIRSRACRIAGIA